MDQTDLQSSLITDLREPEAGTRKMKLLSINR